MTSLPILWPETSDLGELLGGNSEPHWVLVALQKRGGVIPVDSLMPPGGSFPVGTDTILVIAQPYPLAPQENVALDDWVHGGGRVLLFADPMLTAESAFALGDRRRPQDVIILTPILKRWGLEMLYDPEQAPAARTAKVDGLDYPVNLAGSFELLPESNACKTESDGLIADCRIGKGHVIAIADAALLEEAEVDEIDSRAEQLDRLLLRLGD